MELNIGDYVRINNNFNIIFIGIGKIIKINQDTIYIDMKSNLPITANIEDITNHSEDIINLIEVGDYVNNHQVIMNLKDSKFFYNSENDFVTCNGYTFENDEIESVLTHEQFDNMKYEVK